MFIVTSAGQVLNDFVALGIRVGHFSVDTNDFDIDVSVVLNSDDNIGSFTAGDGVGAVWEVHERFDAGERAVHEFWLTFDFEVWVVAGDKFWAVVEGNVVDHVFVFNFNVVFFV